MPFLSPLLAPEFPALQFTFGLEPVIQIAARLLAAFKVNFVCAASDFLLASWISDLSGSCLAFYVFISHYFR
jgi:hypothetical protein